MLVTFRNDGRKAAIVFIHGLFGDPGMSWEQFWKLLASDPLTEAWDCFSFGYSARRLNLLTVASMFYQALTFPPLNQYERIAIVAHSTGGLITQIALLDHRDLADRVAYVFFFALPSRGLLPDTTLKSTLFLRPMLKLMLGAGHLQFQPGSPLLSDLSVRWDKSFGTSAPFVYYSIGGARDSLVMLGTLATLKPEHRLIVDEDHVSLIKPTASRRESIDIVITALNDQSVPAAPRHKASVVADVAAKERESSFDVFLYYSSRADSDAVRGIAQRLFGIGKNPWLIDEQGVGQDWWPKLMSQIERIGSVAIFIGHPTASWKKGQFLAVIDEFSKRGKPILPVFLPTAPIDDSDLPDLLQTIVPVNWNDAHPDAFDQLLAGIEGRRVIVTKQTKLAPTLLSDGDGTKHTSPRLGISRRRRFLWVGLVSCAALIVGLIVLLNRGIISIDRSPFDIKATYVGPEPFNKPIAVVFVHGIFGTRDGTWMNQGTSFPALLESDPEFHNKLDVFVYEYFAPKFGNANSIVGLADQFRGSLEDHRVFDDHQYVVFVSHSMGGLVVREFLLNNRDHLAKVPMLYFYSTPTNGAEVTVVADKISNNPQLSGMLPLEGNELLQSIQSGWLSWDAAKKLRSYCAYETLPTYGVMIVSEPSAIALCNQSPDPITANHIDIVKPKDRDDPRYSRLAHALRSALSTQAGSS